MAGAFQPNAFQLDGFQTDAGGSAGTGVITGVSASAVVGTLTAIGAANASLTGVGASASVGTLTAAGGASIPATASLTGVSAQSSIGSLSAIGASNVIPFGVAATASVGTITATGAGKATLTGVFATAAVGTLTADPGLPIPATAFLIGVEAHADAGILLADGGGEDSGGGYFKFVLAKKRKARELAARLLAESLVPAQEDIGTFETVSNKITPIGITPLTPAKGLTHTPFTPIHDSQIVDKPTQLTPLSEKLPTIPDKSSNFDYEIKPKVGRVRVAKRLVPAQVSESGHVSVKPIPHKWDYDQLLKYIDYLEAV